MEQRSKGEESRSKEVVVPPPRKRAKQTGACAFPDVEENDAEQPPAPKKRRGRRGPFLTGGRGIRQVPGSEKDMFQCRAVMRWQPPMQSLASFGNNCKRRKRRSKPPSMSETWVVLTAQNQMTRQW